MKMEAQQKTKLLLEAELFGINMLVQVKELIEQDSAEVFLTKKDIECKRGIKDISMVKLLHNNGVYGLTYEPKTKTLFTADYK
jgi:hypothetical protein